MGCGGDRVARTVLQLMDEDDAWAALAVCADAYIVAVAVSPRSEV